MLKTLLKKQLFELNRGFFYDQKKNTNRSKASTIFFIVGYAALMIGVLGSVFTFLAIEMFNAMHLLQLDWLFYVIMSLIALALGVFGSVFNTFSGLYQAKDNDLLLSMPIPVKYILISRLLGVYLMGLMFSAVVLLPAVIVGWIKGGVTVSAIVGGVLLLLLISVIVLILSCILGWVIAKLSTRLKNKSIITVLISLAGIALYYFCYFKANELLQQIIVNALTIGVKLKSYAYPLFVLGNVGAGDWLSMLEVTAIVAALFWLTYRVLSHGFLKLATSMGNVARVKYKAKQAKQRTPAGAMFGKELSHWISSPTYMLNCSLGTVFILAAGVVLLIKGSAVAVLQSLISEDLLALLLAGAVCMLASVNDLTAPSVSLEGKSIWILQSLPVDYWLPLRAKLQMHLLLTLVPTMFCQICVLIIFRLSLIPALLFMIFPILSVILTAEFGLVVNLKYPNLNWVSETVAVKQGMSVLIGLFGGWVYVGVLAIVFFILKNMIAPLIYLAIASALTVAIVVLFYRWLKTHGTEIFAKL